VTCIARAIAAGALSEAVVRQLLENAGHACGLAKDDGIASVHSTIKSGLRTGMERPADLTKIGRRFGARRRSSSSTARLTLIDGQPSRQVSAAGRAGDAEIYEPLTDLGNAQRFVKRHGKIFKSCPVLGWLAWIGDRWSLDAAEGLIDKAVHDVVRAIKAESDDEQVSKWAHTSQGARHIGCIAKLARPYLEISAAALDADPFKINTRSGTLVVRRSDDDYVTMKPHDPLDLITKIAPVAYDPAATCPMYDRFLEEVQPDEKMRRFLHQWGGLSLTGDTSEQRMVVFWAKAPTVKALC
jgi:putative DNA primase/helicase